MVTGHDQAPGRRWLGDLGSVAAFGARGSTPGQPQGGSNRQLAVIKEDSNRRHGRSFHLEGGAALFGARAQEDARG